jgi:hypothetical protein
MARKQYPIDVYLSPPFAIKRFLGLRQKHGDKAAVTKSEYKPEREAWITGVFLLGLSKIAKREFWLRVNTEDTVPDVYTISFVETARGVTAEMQNVEVFEYESHAHTDIIGAIENKLKGKVYPDNYILLCYVHDRTGEVFNTNEIYERVKVLNLKIAEVWVLANILTPTNAEHVIFQVFPTANGCKFDYLEECKNSKQKDMINAKRGSAKKIEFIPMGKAILRLP